MSRQNELSSEDARENTHLPQYSPPATGVLSVIPSAWAPYGELARIHRPNGFLLVYFPHLFGTIYSLCLHAEHDPLELIRKNAILLVGSIFSRSSICAWNDIIDREYDRQVPRCCQRPIARGAIRPAQGLLFTVFLTVPALACLYGLPRICWIISIPDMFLMALYPFAKRFMDFPQVILGIQLAMGFLMGKGAMNAGLSLSDVPFYFANVCWTIIYDTVYAQLDVEDDAKAGVRSMAVLFRGRTKSMLCAVSFAKVALLFVSGYLQDFGRGYAALTGGGTLASLSYMLLTIDLSKPSDCLWWFQNGFWFIGLSVSAGLGLEYLGWR
ncbi:hypothetical protein MGN70_008613 [Eutypa lata]|nr:hypothetical protein MGN70_008613 [Eutypa lata]